LHFCTKIVKRCVKEQNTKTRTTNYMKTYDFTENELQIDDIVILIENDRIFFQIHRVNLSETETGNSGGVRPRYYRMRATMSRRPRSILRNSKPKGIIKRARCQDVGFRSHAGYENAPVCIRTDRSENCEGFSKHFCQRAKTSPNFDTILFRLPTSISYPPL